MYSFVCCDDSTGVDKACMRFWLEGEEKKNTKMFKKAKLMI